MLDTERGDDLDELLRRLTEAINWCAPRATLHDPKDCLRSPRLAPEPLAGSRKDVVRSVALSRNIELKWPKPQSAEGLAGGRLLGYEPDGNLSCGAAEVETGGIVDCLNVPPWDTWVAYISEPKGMNYLVAWIPPVFVDLMSNGIDVNPEGCIWWVDESETHLRELLRQRGVIPATRGSAKEECPKRGTNPMWDREFDT